MTTNDEELIDVLFSKIENGLIQSYCKVTTEVGVAIPGVVRNILEY